MEQRIAIGTYDGYGERKSLWLDESERLRHFYCVGTTGAGKTTLLQSLIIQDIHAGRGVCLIDPHGDIAEAVADSIPEHRINDVTYWNVADRQHPIGFNILDDIHTVDDADQLASQVITTLRGMFEDKHAWGEWLEYLLKHSTFAVAMRPVGAATLIAVQRLLEDGAYRKQVLADLQDPVASSFWQNWFQNLKQRESLERTSSTLNKLGKFSLPPVLRNIIGQTKSGFDIQRIMDERKVLIVNLAKGQIGKDNADFLGSLIVSKIVGTAFKRSAIPEAERVPFYLYIDEFQTVTTNEFTDIVSEARKYALSLTLAHQNFDQIDTNVLQQIIKTVGTIAVFRVAFGDSDALESALRPTKRETLEGSGNGEFYIRRANGGVRVTGHHPSSLADCHTGSLQTVIKNTRWRHSRPRSLVEHEFSQWFPPAQTPQKKASTEARRKIKKIEYFE